MRLVADIGGTNARLAVCEGGRIVPQSTRSFKNDEWAQFGDLFDAYLNDQHYPTLTDLVVAVAGPVRGDDAALTNRNWTFNTTDLKRVANCHAAHLLNDLTALGYAVPQLGADQVKEFHAGNVGVLDRGQSLVVGIGTGFNVSPVIQSGETVQCLVVEAGHVSLPSRVSACLTEIGGNASVFPTVESLFSGRGFITFCRQICTDDTRSGVDIIASYGLAGAERSTAAVNHYAALLGEFLRDLSLAYMPNSGVYLAGSVARAVMDCAPSHCLTTFMEPCIIRNGQSPALFSITDDRAALQGCCSFN